MKKTLHQNHGLSKGSLGIIFYLFTTKTVATGHEKVIGVAVPLKLEAELNKYSYLKHKIIFKCGFHHLKGKIFYFKNLYKKRLVNYILRPTGRRP